MSAANFSGILVEVGDWGGWVRSCEGRKCIPGVVSYQAVEVEVVVVSHGGIVEDRGHLRTLGVFDQQFTGFGVRVDGV